MRSDRLHPAKQPALHYATLAAILLLGLGLRFWHLDAKPLWLDEVLTALFSMGRTQADVPLNAFFPLTALDQLFTYQPGVSCPQITQTVATASVHPPVFFCLMYAWMGWLPGAGEHWVWALRSLPALFGVAAIAAVYLLNRLAISPAAALMAAALMAVSPFAVYLSQEARHYTLPMLLITLALVGLVQLQRDLIAQRLRPAVWLGWTAINAFSLYVHYFCLLALVAQVAALGGWLLWRKQRLSWHQIGAVALALGAIGLSYLPWIPTVLNHFSRPETDWLSPYQPDWKDRIAPLYQTLMNWVLMGIALPVENQPEWIAVPAVLLMLAFTLWLAWQARIGARHLWMSIANRAPLVLIIGFTLTVLMEFLAIVYLLDKDLTVVPRYSFVYYPGLCALLGASLAHLPRTPPPASPIPPVRAVREPPRPRRLLLTKLYPLNANCLIVLLIGLLSSLIVVHGLAFQKSYNPNEVVDDLLLKPAAPTIAVVSYKSLQEVALGLSFALELHQRHPELEQNGQIRFAFVERSPGYRQFWQRLQAMPLPLPLPLNLWVVASPGMRSKHYPDRLRFQNTASSVQPRKAVCDLDPEEFHRIGFPYQLFRCRVAKKQ